MNFPPRPSVFETHFIELSTVQEVKNRKMTIIYFEDEISDVETRLQEQPSTNTNYSK